MPYEKVALVCLRLPRVEFFYCNHTWLTIVGQTHYRPLETQSVNVGTDFVLFVGVLECIKVCILQRHTAGIDILIVCPTYGDYDTVFDYHAFCVIVLKYSAKGPCMYFVTHKIVGSRKLFAEEKSLLWKSD